MYNPGDDDSRFFWKEHSMSGGGGGGGRASGFAASGDGGDCGELSFQAALQSVQPDAVEDLSVGEILDVALRTDGHPPVIEVRTAEGAVVGALIQRVPELLRCIQDGFQYVAEVLHIEGGHVRVEVRAP
jgi:hypothetical protein